MTCDFDLPHGILASDLHSPEVNSTLRIVPVPGYLESWARDEDIAGLFEELLRSRQQLVAASPSGGFGGTRQWTSRPKVMHYAVLESCFLDAVELHGMIQPAVKSVKSNDPVNMGWTSFIHANQG